MRGSTSQRTKRKEDHPPDVAALLRKGKVSINGLVAAQHALRCYTDLDEKEGMEGMIQTSRIRVAFAKLAVRRIILDIIDASSDLLQYPAESFDEEGAIDWSKIFCSVCLDSSCGGDDDDNDEEEEEGGDGGNDIILCDGLCRRGFHQRCHDPKVVDLKNDDWFCCYCDALLECLDMLNESLELGFEPTSYDELSEIFVDVAICDECASIKDPQSLVGMSLRYRGNRGVERTLAGRILSFSKSEETFAVQLEDGRTVHFDQIELSNCIRVRDTRQLNIAHADSDSETDSDYAPCSSSSNVSECDGDDDDSENTENEEEEEEEEKDDDEDDGTRWGWVPHESGEESGWMDREKFESLMKKFKCESEQQWDTAPSTKLPGMQDFQRYYGAQHWKEHFDWHMEEEIPSLVETRSPRRRERVNYAAVAMTIAEEEQWPGSESDGSSDSSFVE